MIMARQRTVGIGLGPSNLALAIALAESSASQECGQWLFLEQNETIKWHPDMLLEGSRLQISFLKDLVTLRNPTSFYTFINYLKSQDRLDYFINRGTFNASRNEFTDYLRWVHRHLPTHLSQMSRTVQEVVPVIGRNGQVEALEVLYTDNEGNEYRIGADNMVVAVGGTPMIPEAFQPVIGKEVFHSSRFLSHIEAYKDAQSPLRFGVVGSGQSAVEIIQYLHNHYPHSQIHSIFRKAAYKPADNSPFVNEVFFPSMTDFMYGLADDGKRLNVLGEYWQTNYAAVELELLEGLYEKLYADRVSGVQQIHIHNYTKVESVQKQDRGFRLSVSDVMSGDNSCVDLDVIVLATGYARAALPAFLDPIASYIRSANGRLSIGRDYALETNAEFNPRVYVQGISQLTHGISDSLLSVLAVRSQEILESILSEQGADVDKFKIRSEEVLV